MTAPPQPEVDSFRAFELSEEIFETLDESGFVRPTPIQALSIRPAMAGRDLLARAPTGTGKTLAFAIPALERLHRASPSARTGTRIVVLAPTRELALQIRGVMEVFASKLGMRTVALVGGIPLRSDFTALESKPHVVVATPGRLLDHLESRRVDLSRTAILVLDEADRMLDLGFLPQVYRILAAMSAKRQTMLFSATLPTDITNLAHKHLKRPVRLEVGPPTSTASGAHQRVLFVGQEQKVDCLIALLREEEGTCLVFVGTKVEADSLYRRVRAADLPVAVIHGNLAQTARMKALEAFQEAHARILIATDVAGRGLDVEGIAHVVNFDAPLRPDDYIHRIGRTARADATGIATTLVSYDELDNLMAIERHLRKPIPAAPLPGGLTSPPWAATVRRSDPTSLKHEGLFAPRGFRIGRRRR